MKKIFMFILWCLSVSLLALSYNNADKIALGIPISISFSSQGIADYIDKYELSEEEKIRIIYVWIAKNIDYDLNISAIELDSKVTSTKNTLSSRKGVCQDYAELFQEIANKCSITSYVIGGYTRQEDIITDIGHAWIAIKYKNSQWLLCDPTWAAGFVQNQKYIKKFSDEYFNVKAEEFIKTHIPFDPLWQLLPSPITHKDFYLQNYHITKNKNFIFSDSIKVYENLSELDKLTGISRRVEACGILNNSTLNYINFINHNIEALRYNQKVNVYNKTADAYNAITRKLQVTINLFNNYINYKNNQYQPNKSGQQILIMLIEIETRLNGILKQITEVKTQDTNFQKSFAELKTNILEIKERVKEEILFIKKKYRLK